MKPDHPPCGYDSTGFPARADDRPVSTRVESITEDQLLEQLAKARARLAEVGPVNCEHPVARAVSSLERLLARIGERK